MRVLLVTNDFPPTLGGIQSYLRDFLATLDPRDVVVFASVQDAEAAREWDQRAPYRVYRWNHKVMLPGPRTAREMARIIARENIDTVWFGAAAPLALLGASARKAGARRIVASTHGHEVGWSMLPGARQVLRRIGATADVVTYISDYTLRRFRTAFGSTTFVHLPSGVDVERFVLPSPQERSLARKHLGWDKDAPTVLCASRLVPRKGQDELIKAWPEVLRAVPDAQLKLVGQGRIHNRLARAIAKRGLGTSVSLVGRLTEGDLARSFQAADVFAMPCRTRGWGLDVEGLGIVYLEAQAAGLPVIAGDSGGAPETVTPAAGRVVRAKDTRQLARDVVDLLTRPGQMGVRGREHVKNNWTWDIMEQRLRSALFGAIL